MNLPCRNPSSTGTLAEWLAFSKEKTAKMAVDGKNGGGVNGSDSGIRLHHCKWNTASLALKQNGWKGLRGNCAITGGKLCLEKTVKIWCDGKRRNNTWYVKLCNKTDIANCKNKWKAFPESDYISVFEAFLMLQKWGDSITPITAVVIVLLQVLRRVVNPHFCSAENDYTCISNGNDFSWGRKCFCDVLTLS